MSDAALFPGFAAQRYSSADLDQDDQQDQNQRGDEKRSAQFIHRSVSVYS